MGKHTQNCTLIGKGVYGITPEILRKLVEGLR